MNRERWGTFSVKDHLMPRAFVADVLLYNRLVIPSPPNDEERKRWFEMGWQPYLLNEKLETLRDLAVIVPWDQYRQQQFKNRHNLNKAVSFDMNDAYYSTRMVLAQEALPPRPKDVEKVWPIAAYPAIKNYQKAQQDKTKEEKQEELIMVLSHKFLVPEDSDKTDKQLLQQAIRLASRDDFNQKRQELYKWQDDIIEQQIPPDIAVAAMESKLEEYNKVLRKGKLKMIYKYAFLVLEVGLGIAGAKLGEPIATTAALAGITKFALLDSKFEIDDSNSKAASMIHDFQKEFY
jgi:hypothetical protein